MRLTSVAQKIVRVVGILAAVLLVFLLCAYLIFGRKAKEERPGEGAKDFTNLALVPFDEKDEMLTPDLMEKYDFTVLEIWYPESADCVRYMSEMNLFAEECLHRDDEMYAYVTGVCINLYDKQGALLTDRLDTAKDICSQEHVMFHQYIADPDTEQILQSMGVSSYPTVIILNRRGEVLNMITDMDGKELCMHLDTLVDEYMKEKRKLERQERQENLGILKSEKERFEESAE